MDTLEAYQKLDKLGTEELGNNWYLDYNDFVQVYEKKLSLEAVLDYYIYQMQESFKYLDTYEKNDDNKEQIKNYELLKKLLKEQYD